MRRTAPAPAPGGLRDLALGPARGRDQAVTITVIMILMILMIMIIMIIMIITVVISRMLTLTSHTHNIDDNEWYY